MYLNCKSWFSFRYGTLETEALVKLASKLGIPSLALTNINNTQDTWDFVGFCGKQDVKPIAGTEIRNDSHLCYVLLAQNNEGFLHINRFLSEHLQEKKPFPDKPFFPGSVWVIYPFGRYQPHELQHHEFIGVQTTEVNKLYGTNTHQYARKFVIRHPVTFQNDWDEKKKVYIKDKGTGYNVHRLLRAIDKNVIGSKQQPTDVAAPHEQFIPPSELLGIFSNYPDIVANTRQLMDSCSIGMDFKSEKTKRVYSATAYDDKNLLAKLALDGLKRRYGPVNRVAKERVEKELQIINTQGYNSYFLITWDILRYARNRDFFFVGRGSGANSIVAYCLDITDVDPLDLDLYFERFLNPQRSSPPDFDIDFSWKDRDEITDYIFKRYGREHVCLLGSVTTFQKRGAIRELGKVFGLPKAEIDAMEQEGAEHKDDSLRRQVRKYSDKLKDFPNHLSIHAGGVLISDAPVHQYTATELPPKGLSTSQIDMHIAEKIRLTKFDILSQRGLGHIRDSIELIRQNQGVNVNIHDVAKLKKDTALAARIRAADTIGCFYIESPAMRQLLKKLECNDYLTLVAASSIIRPGVAQSGMMRQYIYRYHNPDKFEYLHPKMKELLEETYGVMVYQEDVIKVAHHFAGLDMDDADVLRRLMSGKYRGHERFEEIRQTFFSNCAERGYPDEISQEVWRQIESFGGYSFSKAHSASFAVESYQSLFLKTYYPAEFMVAVINNFGGFYNTELYFHELKRCGVIVLPPCVNRSQYLTRIEGTTVYAGFIHIQGLEETMVTALLEERSRNGPYEHLQHFIERTAIGLEQLNILVRVGALRFTGKSKKELLWEANFLQKKNRYTTVNAAMFTEPPLHFTLPRLSQHPLDDILDEIELLGFPIGNVWNMVDIDTRPYQTAAELPALLGKTIQVIGYYVTTKAIRTATKKAMHFGTFLDKQGDWIDTVHFPHSFQYTPFEGKGFYELRGKVVEEFGVYAIEVSYCKKIGLKETK
ncbi:MAG: DNA polymerase III subunit alpha [Williamsia sp.]|nr:DNA polymerase III subunit alpha [Williamsia sp.]